MAIKPRAGDLQRREQRQRSYISAMTIGRQFPKVKELSLELRFTEAAQKPFLSPYRQIYTADMQAFFKVQCPFKDCKEGGFDLQRAVASAAGNRDGLDEGQMRCLGAMPQGVACPVEMVYKITAAAI